MDLTEAAWNLTALALGASGRHIDQREINAVTEDVSALVASVDNLAANSNERPEPTVQDPFVTLGVARDAMREEISKAFKRQMAANAPDRVAQMSPAIQAFATEQAKKINAAYQAIKKMQGW